jgi:signal transduction histidine kinase/CheY-like chemotaxis protein/HAMP domain-containing protein
MTELTRRMAELQRLRPSPALAQQIAQLRDIATGVGEEAIQSATRTSIMFALMLVAVAVGLWYNRRRFAAPFHHVAAALERVAAGHYSERLAEDQSAEFGLIAQSVNRMAAALTWRERMQEQLAQLLTAINSPPTEKGAGGFGPTLEVLAAATGASALALYQPHYDTNEWGATAVRRATAHALTRDVVRRLVGDAPDVIQYAGAAAQAVREQLRLSDGASPGGTGGVALLPLRSRNRLVGLLAVLLPGELIPDAAMLLQQAAPNLATACERESAHQHTRRLAVEVRHAAQRLESQNAELTTLNDKLEDQHFELSRLNAELDQANRLKDQFLANVSHELRTPLNSVIGFSDLLLTQDVDGPPLSETQRDYLGTIARNGRHLLRLINELLDLSKIAAGRMELHPEPVALDALCREAAESVRAQVAGRKHAFRFECPTEPVIVTGDRGRLLQVLLNLLSNGVKYTPRGGTVTVSCDAETADRLRVRVRDTGPGIAPEMLARLFTPFDRLGAEATGVEGTGLGLTLSRHLMEAMGGALRVDSQVGVGSTFSVELPVAATPLEALPRPWADAPAAAGPTAAVILYIEDNLSNLRLVERILARRPGVRLLSAMQGRVGIDLAREHRPDLILLDQHLPDVAGDEVLRALRADARTHEIPVVMLSADANPRQIQRLREAGARDYLTKPLDVKRFLALVDGTLGERGSV